MPFFEMQIVHRSTMLSCSSAILSGWRFNAPNSALIHWMSSEMFSKHSPEIRKRYSIYFHKKKFIGVKSYEFGGQAMPWFPIQRLPNIVSMHSITFFDLCTAIPFCWNHIWVMSTPASSRRFFKSFSKNFA